MNEYIDTRSGWRKLANDEPVAGAVEQVHHYRSEKPTDSHLQVAIWVRDPEMGTSAEHSILLSDDERTRLHDALQEYLVAHDIPEESQGDWATISGKLLEGMEA